MSGRPKAFSSKEKEEGRRKERAESREQRAESREQRAENREQRTENRTGCKCIFSSFASFLLFVACVPVCIHGVS